MVSDRKIWIDGCFDFFHHGHAGALLQARQLGDELIVGVHTDEDIAHNKGPVVMTLDERIRAVDACKWSTQSVPGAPYVTQEAVMDRHDCRFVVHGDDITTDKDGNDCYQQVKEAGRFVVVKRTPEISTTDLVGRMLSRSTDHHLGPLSRATIDSAQFQQGLDRFRRYASASDGWSAGAVVYAFEGHGLERVVEGSPDLQGKPVFYVDGGFDLFFVGHIELLRAVHDMAQAAGAVVVVGIHTDEQMNASKGGSYPIMNQFERALCVLQCRFVQGLVLNAPFTLTPEFLTALGQVPERFTVVKVLHGATQTPEPYLEARRLGLYVEVPPHLFSDMTAETIVDRVMANRELYEERQRRKGWKAQHEQRLRLAVA